MVPSDHDTDRRIAWWGPRRQLQDGLLACFSVPFATAKAGSWSHFLGGDIGGLEQPPASVQKNTFSHDRQHS
jgi:hypothetical protein